jgi:hypothetical protein
MEREGKKEEYERRILEYRASGERGAQATWKTMFDMGYKDPRTERSLSKDFAVGLREELRKVTKAERRKYTDAESARRSFEAALNTLPHIADPQVELDWIRAHPAMNRNARYRGSKQQGNPMTILRVDDVLDAPHGPAPSKSAVSQLQHWCNNTDQFFKMMLDHQKKAIEKKPAEKTIDEEVVDDDSDTIKRLLKEVRNVVG